MSDNQFGIDLAREEVIDMMKENLNHARHLENERLTFNSIYIAIVAGFLAFALDFENPFVSLAAAFVLLVLSVIGILLTKRWSDVYEGHMRKAKELAYRIYGHESYKKDEIVNKYYYFSHDYSLMEREKYRKKKKMGEDDDFEFSLHGIKHAFCQIRTKTLFYSFYAVILGVLIVVSLICVLNLAGF